MKKILLGGFTLLIALLPFSTVLVVWLTSDFGLLYLWYGWKEILIALLAVISLVLVAKNSKIRQVLLSSAHNKLAFLYLGLCVIYVLTQKLSVQSLVGLATNTRFVVMFLISQVVVFYYPKILKNLPKKIVLVATVVASFGLMQVLVFSPYLLTHIGYDAPGIQTSGIPPAIHKVAADSDMYRAQSTLRGPNVFGAYLILPIFLAIALLQKNKDMSPKKSQIKSQKKSQKWIMFSIPLMIGALLVSHSRSAVLGLILGLLIWSLIVFRSNINFSKKNLKRVYVGVFVLVLAVTIALPFVWNNDTFQEVVLHNNPEVQGVQSNEGHVLLARDALMDVAKNPLGKGLGTAGPVSVIEDDGQQESGRISENYFLQIGQEMGWAGVLLFTALQLQVIRSLWIARSTNRYALPIMLSMIGLVLTNMLLHTWTDETVSIMAWSVAGLAVGHVVSSKKSPISLN